MTAPEVALKLRELKKQGVAIKLRAISEDLDKVHFLLDLRDGKQTSLERKWVYENWEGFVKICSYDEK